MDIGGQTGQWKQWLLYGAVAAIVIVIILALLGIPVLGGTGGTGKPPAEIVFWRKPDPLVPLRVTATELGKGGLDFDRYTMMVDMVWLNTRVPVGADPNYRHILHRGSGEGADFLQLTAGIRNVGTEAGLSVGPSATEILRRMPQGLPIRMNPGILADPFKNDMILFVDTEAENRNLRESVRVADIPMDQPFCFALVVMPTLIEVYVNGRLEVTKLLEGRPRAIESNWYGLVGPSPLNGKIQNLRLFKGILGPAQIQSYCKGVPTFPDGPTACEQRQIQAQAAMSMAN